MTPREKHIMEINRLKTVLNGDISPKLRRDYTKALFRKIKELREYDSYIRGVING